MSEPRSFDPSSFRGFIAAFDEERTLAALKDFPGLLASPDAEVLHEGRNRIIAVRLPGGREAVVKIFGARGFQKWKTFFVQSKGLRAWRGAQALKENSFGTATPIAAFERRSRGLAVESVYIAGRVRGGREIREWFRDRPEPDLRNLLAALAPVLARMHQAGIVHRDLSDGNILVIEKAPSRFEFLFLDTNRIRAGRKVGLFARARNLVRLGVPAALQRYFIEEYVFSAGPHFRRRRFGFYYRTAKRTFASWLTVKKKLRLRKAARRFGLQ